MDAAIDFLPTSIEHLRTEKTASSCYSISWTEDNRVLCSINKGIEVRDETLQIKQTIKIQNQSYTFSAALIDNILYTHTFCNSNKRFSTWIGSLQDTPTQSILHTESHDAVSQITHLSADRNYVASIDYVHKLLKIFESTNAEHMFDIDMTYMGDLFGVHLIREAVLITDLNGGKLSKYALSISPQPI